MYIWTFYVHSQKFVKKKTFCVTYVKNDKTIPRKKSYFKSPKIVFLHSP
jgi:hypothetical protein